MSYLMNPERVDENGKRKQFQSITGTAYSSGIIELGNDS
jgi:hypothetical protein